MVLRLTEKKQTSIKIYENKKYIAQVCKKIERIIDDNPEILQFVSVDLSVAKKKGSKRGRRGLTAKTVLVLMIYKYFRGLTYEGLENEIEESISLRQLLDLEHVESSKLPAKSTIFENISRISPVTIENIIKNIVKYSIQTGYESADEILVDSTAIAMDVESPCDAKLLYTGCKVLTRQIKKICEETKRTPPENNMSDIKKLMLKAIGVYKKPDSKTALLKKMIRLTNGKIKEAEIYKRLDKDRSSTNRKTGRAIKDLIHYLKLTKQAVEQVKYHVTTGETLPASDILYSYFQTDAKLIKKGGRQDTIGKKIFIVTGANGMIMTPTVCLENDNDARTLKFMMDEHIDDYGVPTSIAADRGFISKPNIEYLKEIGVENPAVALKSNFTIENLAISEETYIRLQRSRSKVEAVISHMKRIFGLRRTTSRKDNSAEKYILAGIMAYNFVKLANLMIKNRKLK